jgi:hypothetical protein
MVFYGFEPPPPNQQNCGLNLQVVTGKRRAISHQPGVCRAFHYSPAVPTDQNLTSLRAKCLSCCDQFVHLARAFLPEIRTSDQMRIDVNNEEQHRGKFVRGLEANLWG